MKTTLPVIILNWNNFPDTEACTRSIRDTGSDVYITLVDNASKKEVIEDVKGIASKYQVERLVLNSENLGFARAHNQIFQELLDREAYVFVLNNDTEIDPELFTVLTNRIEVSRPDMLTCKMINFWDKTLMDNAGHRMLTSGEIIPVGHGRSKERYNQRFENIGACAGAGLYSTEMLRDIGLFDEYFKTGYEDAEFGLRAFIAGYKCEYEPGAIVYHKMGQSIKKVFNYQYTLKIQTNIFYTYWKLAHWQVIAINIIPIIIRFFVITIINILFWRIKYLKVQYHALFIILFRDYRQAVKARRESRRLRRIPWWKLLMKQEFFLQRDVKNFYRFIIKGEKSYFERY